MSKSLSISLDAQSISVAIDEKHGFITASALSGIKLKPTKPRKKSTNKKLAKKMTAFLYDYTIQG